MTGRGVAAGANAKLSLETEESGNNRLTLNVQHLLPPERIAERYERFSVWITPQGEDVRLAGRLVYDREDRAGHFSTTTPYEDVDVLVTAEANAQPDRPRGHTIFQGRISTS